MALPALADVDLLAERLGSEVADLDNGQAEMMLEYASALVRSFAGRNWVDAHGNLSGVPESIPGVVVEVVSRAVNNPSGATQETTGPFTVSWGPNAAQRMYLTASDRSIIRRAVQRPHVWTLGTTRGQIETGYVDVAGSDRPLPAATPW